MPDPIHHGGGSEQDTPVFGRLKRRADFLHVGKGRRWHGKAMTVQVSPRRTDPSAAGQDCGRGFGRDGAPAAGEPARFGFTLTKKVGCAVVRNRSRRRLREAVRLSPDLPAAPGHDYVIVGRLESIRLPFERLLAELAHAVDRVHAANAPRGGGRHPSRRK